MDTLKINKLQTKIISDGGNSLTEIDHTYPAFLGACNKTYEGILCYVRFTKDRQIVVARQRTLNVGQKIHISQEKYSYLATFNFTRPFANLTLLKDVLALAKLYNKKVFLKLCPPIGRLELELLYQELKLFNPITNLTICSDDERLLKYFRNQNFAIKLELRINEFDDCYLELCQKYHYNLAIPYNKLNFDLVDMLHSFRIIVGITQINNPIEASVAVANKVDYFYTKVLE